MPDQAQHSLPSWMGGHFTSP